MALTDYMGDAPGFMSYGRNRRTDGIRVPERAKPAQEAAPLKTFDLEFEGNPGDKQWLYDRNETFNKTVSKLYKEYGGEMDWVRADDRYKQAVAEDGMFVKNQQAAIQNRENTKARLQDLKNMSSGQADSDYELQYENGIYVAKKFDDKGRIKTKGDYVQDAIWKPQVTNHEDGSVGIDHTKFDYGTGDENDMTSLLTKVFTGLGANEWGNDVTRGSDLSEKDYAGINYKMNSLVQNARQHKDNYEQVNDATNYLINYGFDENHRYYISQKMMHDYEAGKAFTAPKMTDDGKLELDAKGRPKLEQRYLTKEDVSNPERMKALFSYYVQDYVSDFAKKYLDKSDMSKSVDKQTFANIDPYTGQKKVPEKPLERWEAVLSDVGPKSPEHTRTNTTYVVGPDGKVKQYEDNLLVYNDGNFGEKGMDQPRAAINGKKLNQFMDKSGQIMVGGMWQDMPESMKDAQVSDVVDVRQVRTADGKNTQWVATVAVAMDEDSDGFNKLNVYDPITKSKKPIYDANWIGYDGMTDEGERNNVVKYMTRDQIKKNDYILNQDSDGYFDYDSDEKPVVYMQIPVGNMMDTWDQYGVGTATKNANRRAIEVDKRAAETSRRIVQSQIQQSQAKEGTRF